MSLRQPPSLKSGKKSKTTSGELSAATVGPSIAGVNSQTPAKIVTTPDKNTVVAVSNEKIVVLPREWKHHRFEYRFFDKVAGTVPHHEMRAKHTAGLLQLKSHTPLALLSKKLPETFSMRNNVLQVLNQGSLGACVAHSMVQALNIVVVRDHHETQQSRSWLTKRIWSAARNEGFYGSRRFIYYEAREIDGTPITEDAGCTNLSACLAMEKSYVCVENLWPYIEKQYSVKPSIIAYDDAQSHTQFAYSVVNRDDTELRGVKAALASGHPVLFGINVFPSFIQCGLDGGNGDVPMPGSNETSVGGHSLLAVGYDKNFIEYVNHWSTEWGDGGFGRIPIDVLNLIGGDYCAVEKFV